MNWTLTDHRSPKPDGWKLVWDGQSPVEHCTCEEETRDIVQCSYVTTKKFVASRLRRFCWLHERQTFTTAGFDTLHKFREGLRLKYSYTLFLNVFNIFRWIIPLRINYRQQGASISTYFVVLRLGFPKSRKWIHVILPTIYYILGSFPGIKFSLWTNRTSVLLFELWKSHFQAVWDYYSFASLLFLNWKNKLQ